MKRIFIEGNYIIIDFNNGQPTTDLASGKTTAQIRGLNFVFSCTNPQQVENILTSEVANGEWFDETGLVAYDVATLTTLLRTNTANFSSASGGSGAITFLEHVLELSSDDLKAQVFGAILVPEPPVGFIPVEIVSNFYVISKTTPYDVTGANFHINSSTGISVNVPDSMFTFAPDNAVQSIAYESMVVDSPQGIGAGYSKSINLSNFTALTLGDGTLKVITTYALQEIS